MGLLGKSCQPCWLVLEGLSGGDFAAADWVAAAAVQLPPPPLTTDLPTSCAAGHCEKTSVPERGVA